MFTASTAFRISFCAKYRPGFFFFFSVCSYGFLIPVFETFSRGIYRSIFRCFFQWFSRYVSRWTPSKTYSNNFLLVVFRNDGFSRSFWEIFAKVFPGISSKKFSGISLGVFPRFSLRVFQISCCNFPNILLQDYPQNFGSLRCCSFGKDLFRSFFREFSDRFSRSSHKISAGSLAIFLRYFRTRYFMGYLRRYFKKYSWKKYRRAPGQSIR